MNKGIIVSIIFVMLYFSPSLLDLANGNGEVSDMIDISPFVSEKIANITNNYDFYAVWLDENKFGLYYELEKGDLK